jgi:hypothetical protein
MIFAKVVTLLQESNNGSKPGNSELPTLAQTAIDLTNIMIPFLPSDTFDSLWNLLVPLLSLKDDPNMQKRAYHCLARFAELGASKQFLLKRLNQVTEILKRTDTHTSAEKVIEGSAMLIPGTNISVTSNRRCPSTSVSASNYNNSSRGGNRH